MEYENDLDIFNSLDEESTPQKSSEENVDGKKDTSQEEVNTEENTSPVIDEQSLLESVLKSRGIDFNNIKIEDTETGVIHSVPFTELSREEQIELLNLEEDDYFKFLEIAKKVLSGTIGNNLLCVKITLTPNL